MSRETGESPYHDGSTVALFRESAWCGFMTIGVELEVTRRLLEETDPPTVSLDSVVDFVITVHDRRPDSIHSEARLVVPTAHVDRFLELLHRQVEAARVAGALPPAGEPTIRAMVERAENFPNEAA